MGTGSLIMFYKLTNQATLDAYNKLVSDRITLHESAKAFAEKFDADPVMLQDSNEIWFYGLKFRNNLKINRNVWTKPCRQYGHSWLRVKALKKEFKEEFDSEKANHKKLYQEHFPNGNRVSKSDFYKTMGLDWSSFFFNSFSCFEHKGEFFIDTTLAITGAVEILGSEYSAAKKESELSKEAA